MNQTIDTTRRNQNPLEQEGVPDLNLVTLPKRHKEYELMFALPSSAITAAPHEVRYIVQSYAPAGKAAEDISNIIFEYGQELFAGEPIVFKNPRLRCEVDPRSGTKKYSAEGKLQLEGASCSASQEFSVSLSRSLYEEKLKLATAGTVYKERAIYHRHLPGGLPLTLEVDLPLAFGPDPRKLERVEAEFVKVDVEVPLELVSEVLEQRHTIGMLRNAIFLNAEENKPLKRALSWKTIAREGLHSERTKSAIAEIAKRYDQAA